jgi:predicted acyltransferase
MFVLSQILASLVIAKDVTASDGARISVKALVYRMLFVPLGSPINASLYYAFAWVLCFYLLAYVMYRKGWFLKV